MTPPRVSRRTPIVPWPAAGTLDAHVRAERVRLVILQAPPAQLVSIVAVGVVCAVLWGVSDHARLITWFVIVTSFTIARIALALAFRARNPGSAQMRRWEAWFVATLAAVSLAWGVGGWLVMPPESPIHQAVVYFFLMGVAGGAVASYSAHTAATTVAICCLMIPATIGFAFEDVPALRTMAAGGTLYLLAAVRSTRTFGFFLRRTFQLQFELHDAMGRAQAQARTDDLTGIANRRAFVEQGRAAVEQARRYGRPLSLVMFDIDHFKKINDTHGHAAGDDVLVAVAATLRRAARASDTPGRLGGEEFAVLLPETEAAEADAFAERLRRDMAAMKVTSDDHVISLTCSFGVAECGPNAGQLDTLLGAADDALYKAKAAGRDRVVRYAGAL
jgi:diguanylate cyclase (GGDEF)-like protein